MLLINGTSALRGRARRGRAIRGRALRCRALRGHALRGRALRDRARGPALRQRLLLTLVRRSRGALTRGGLHPWSALVRASSCVLLVVACGYARLEDIFWVSSLVSRLALFGCRGRLVFWGAFGRQHRRKHCWAANGAAHVEVSMPP